MSLQASKALRELNRRVSEFGAGCGQRKYDLLSTLENHTLPRVSDVLGLHEALCFLRAYPDDAALLAQVERMLSVFDERADVRKHREELANTGIAGTPIYFRFFAASAHWLARRWGPYLTIDWDEFERRDQLELWLASMTLYCESQGLDAYAFDVREWIDRLKGPDETDAMFLLQRFERMPMNRRAGEVLLEDLDVPLALQPGSDTPARTREKYADAATVYQTRPLSRRRPTIKEIVEWRVKARNVSPREGRKVVELARAAMATRSRDLDAFAYGSPHDVLMTDCEGGLQIACIGVVPERRLLIETLYGYMVMKNGVPVGYGAITGLFNSVEVAYTIFDTFRSAEAAMMLGWVLAVTRRLFGADTILIDSYQIGKGNEDALRSGAWWFYQKLGFRPRDRNALRIMRSERKRMKSNPRHRSTDKTLAQLAEYDLFLNLGETRDDVLGLLPLADVGLRLSNFLAQEFGADRENAARVCSREAQQLLGVRNYSRFSAGERLAWNWWAPLVVTLPNIKRWPRADKRALVDLIRAKGGRHELAYLQRFNDHRRLRISLLQLAERGR
jgi:hypothetical protein